MTDPTPNHPAVEAAFLAYRSVMFDEESKQINRLPARLRALASALTAALPHLTADDLPSRLVRDIQARTLRDAARTATHKEDGTPWDRDAVSAWLNGLADNIEGEADHG